MIVNKINLCDLKVVYHVPPLDVIPSLFCEGTIGWKKNILVSFNDSSLSRHRFAIKTGFVIMNG